MSYVMYNPTNANELAKFQGSLIGTMAGHAYYTGVATAPTEAFNQGGWYAIQDTDDGSVSLFKAADDSMYTGSWYSQALDSTFDFSNSNSTTFDESSLSSNMTASEIANLA